MQLQNFATSKFSTLKPVQIRRKVPFRIYAGRLSAMPAKQRKSRLLQRGWSDPLMYSHLAFVPAVVVALCRESPLWEIAVLQTLAAALSLAYHRDYEHQCAMASVQHMCEYCLFVYAWTQTLQSPDGWVLLANMACAGAAFVAYVATNVRRELWYRWHPLGLHVVPGVWSCIIAARHEALLSGLVA